MTRGLARTRAIALLCAMIGLATTACGYRIVRRDDVTAQRFAQDSAARVSLERQIAALRTQWHQDSVRFGTDLAVLRTQQPTAPVANDSIVRARDAEIASLKDQLTKANAELDRIKRRLATPRP